MNENYTENKGCAGLLRNPAHPLFSGFFHRQCVSHINFSRSRKCSKACLRAARGRALEPTIVKC